MCARALHFKREADACDSVLLTLLLIHDKHLHHKGRQKFLDEPRSVAFQESRFGQQESELLDRSHAHVPRRLQVQVALAKHAEELLVLQ